MPRVWTSRSVDYSSAGSRHGIDLYDCQACRRQTSVTAGTVFHRSKVSLPLWFWAIHLMAIDKRGVAALTLARQLGVAYHTAWLLHHKIQQAMVERNGQYKLGGLMERTYSVDPVFKRQIVRKNLTPNPSEKGRRVDKVFRWFPAPEQPRTIDPQGSQAGSPSVTCCGEMNCPSLRGISSLSRTAG